MRASKAQHEVAGQSAVGRFGECGVQIRGSSKHVQDGPARKSAVAIFLVQEIGLEAARSGFQFGRANAVKLGSSKIGD